MAVGLLRVALGFGIRIESAGLRAREGFEPHPEAIRLMQGHGINIASYRSRQVTPDMAMAADLILVMDREQKDWCEALAPSIRGRVFLLGTWLPQGQQGIEDPSCKPPEFFSLVLDKIVQSVAGWRNHMNTIRRTK